MQTWVDEHGVERLPCNRLLADLLERSIISDDGAVVPVIEWLCRQVGEGWGSRDELRQIYQQIGYSLDGYLELFPRDMIEE